MVYEVSKKAANDLRLSEKDYVASIIQRLTILLSTFQGEVVLNRRFGINRRSLDKPIKVARNMLVIDITEAVMEFVPEATILNITFKIDESSPGTGMPVLEVDI